ncbi:MAG: hypothetical protein AAF224_09490 [Pseudomonadota bacterium]
MSKTFKAAPQPKRLEDIDIEAFETAGTGHDRKPSNVGTRKSTNPDSHKPTMEDDREEPTSRLSIDLPESVHRRFKTACSATGKKMTEEIIAFLQKRTLELESESGLHQKSV